MSAYDLREIFEAIFNSDHPMLVEPLEHLITIAKLSLNIDLTTSRISVQSSKDWYQRRQDQYVEKLDKWFAENTYHADEFSDLSSLLELKRKQGITISLALPALNEEETIVNVIQTVRGALMENIPLLDEIVLIDISNKYNPRII